MFKYVFWFLLFFNGGFLTGGGGWGVGGGGGGRGVTAPLAPPPASYGHDHRGQSRKILSVVPNFLCFFPAERFLNVNPNEYYNMEWTQDRQTSVSAVSPLNTLGVLININSTCPDGYFLLCWSDRELSWRDHARHAQSFTDKTAITTHPDGEFWLRESSGARPPLGCVGGVCAGPVHLLLGWRCSPRVQASLRQAAHERGRRRVHRTTTYDAQPSGGRKTRRRRNPRRLRRVRQDAARGAGNARYGFTLKCSHCSDWTLYRKHKAICDADIQLLLYEQTNNNGPRWHQSMVNKLIKSSRPSERASHSESTSSTKKFKILIRPLNFQIISQP